MCDTLYQRLIWSAGYLSAMNQRDSPYTFGAEQAVQPTSDPEGHDLVIIDGEAMTYRHYTRSGQ